MQSSSNMQGWPSATRDEGSAVVATQVPLVVDCNVGAHVSPCKHATFATKPQIAPTESVPRKASRQKYASTTAASTALVQLNATISSFATQPCALLWSNKTTWSRRSASSIFGGPKVAVANCDLHA